MKRTWFVLGIVLLATFGISGTSRAQEEDQSPQPEMIGSIPAVGVRLPDFQWNTLAGAEFTGAHLLGHRTVMLLWSPTCPGSRAVVEVLPEVRSVVSAAAAEFVMVSTDSSRVAARDALSSAVPESQVVIANHVSEVLTNPAAYEGIEGPVLRAVVIPSVLVIDEDGIVRSSKLWENAEAVAEEMERLGARAEIRGRMLVVCRRR